MKEEWKEYASQNVKEHRMKWWGIFRLNKPDKISTSVMIIVHCSVMSTSSPPSLKSLAIFFLGRSNGIVSTHRYKDESNTGSRSCMGKKKYQQNINHRKNWKLSTRVTSSNKNVIKWHLVSMYQKRDFDEKNSPSENRLISYFCNYVALWFTTYCHDEMRSWMNNER